MKPTGDHWPSDRDAKLDDFVDALRDIDVPTGMIERLNRIPHQSTGKRSWIPRNSFPLAYSFAGVAVTVVILSWGLWWLANLTSSPHSPAPLATPSTETESVQPPRYALESDALLEPESPSTQSFPATELQIERMVVQRILQLETRRQAEGIASRRGRIDQYRSLADDDLLATSLISAADVQAKYQQDKSLAEESYRLVETAFPNTPWAAEARRRLDSIQ